MWKTLLSLETRYNMGVDIYWVSGITHPREIESYAPGLKVLGDVRAQAGPIITVAINAA